MPQGPNFGDNVFKDRACKALPPKDRVLSLVEKSFQGFYSVYPLFDKARFMSLFDSLDTSVNDPGRWACLNVVLALTAQFQHGTAQDAKEESETWGRFETAFAVVGQLMTMHVTLWSVQALLGMAIVMQGTPNQGPVSLLVSAAMKLAQRMGLHRQCQDPSISAAEIEERKRVRHLSEFLPLLLFIPSNKFPHVVILTWKCARCFGLRILLTKISAYEWDSLQPKMTMIWMWSFRLK